MQVLQGSAAPAVYESWFFLENILYDVLDVVGCHFSNLLLILVESNSVIVKNLNILWFLTCFVSSYRRSA